jgi:hypothetical protein
MIQKQIKQTLHDIAQEAISDDTDIWPEVQARLPRQQATGHKPVQALARVAVTVAIFLTLGMVSYAVYQNLNRSDPGLEAVHEAGLVTELNLSQTIDDVTVTLDWAYADANRVVINYTLEARDETNLQEIFLELSSLPTNSGSRGWFILYHSPPTSTVTNSDSNIATGSFSFDTTRLIYPWLADLPDEFDLNVEITLLQPPAHSGLSEENRGPIPMSDFDEFGTANFAFTLPVIQTAVITPTEQVVESEEFGIVLKEVRLTPSMTRVTFCYALPRWNEGWMPSATLSTGQPEISAPGTINWVGRDWEAPSRRFCMGMDFPVPYTEQPSTLTLTIHELVLDPASLEERALELQEILAQQGIETEIYDGQFRSPGLPYYPLGVVSAPDDVDPFAALAEASEALTERVEGPWVFEIEVP